MKWTITALLAVLFGCLWVSSAGVAVSAAEHPAAHWPAWRGPEGNGVSTEKDFPGEWSKMTNVKWRAPLPEPGNSTPIVYGDRVFLTQPLTERKQRALLCFERLSGRLLWQSAVDAREDEPTHETNPPASASPVTDGERVVCWFGSTGVIAFGFDGKILWQRDLGLIRHVFGYGGSPVLHGGLCYLNFGPGAREFLVALDARTGDIAWVVGPSGDKLAAIPAGANGLELAPEIDGKREERDIYGNWATPIVVREGERDAIVCPFRDLLVAVDSRSGELIWKCRGMGPQTKASPIAGAGIIHMLGGKDSTTIAVRQGGRGDVTDTHLVWKESPADSRMGTGVISDGLVFTNHRNGILECAELETGKVLWKERHQGTGNSSDTWASLFLADGKVFAINQGGDTFVIAASREYKLLATNTLGEKTNSSVVGTAGAFYIRTHQALWCIAKVAGGLEIGAVAPDFKLPGVDGKDHSLSDFATARVLTVLFTCNHCPTAQAYESRLLDLHRDFKDRGVALVAISPNDPEAVRLDELGYTDVGDTLEDMKLRAQQLNFAFPYLFDGETQSVSRAYGPIATPHLMVFDAERRLRYSGRIDDDESGKKIQSTDARNAIEALLQGKPIAVEKTRSFGCSIKWSDKREDNQRFLRKLAEEKVALERLDIATAKTLRQPSDKLRLINVWATWCGPCVAELPDLVECHRMYRQRKFELVTISLDRLDKQADALDMLKKAQASSVNYIFGAEGRDALAEVLEKSWSGALPFTLLVKPTGEVVYQKEGQVDPLELRRAIVGVLGRTY